MSRSPHVVRELRLILTLERCRYGKTLQELAADLGVTDRTIREDSEALESAGVPLIELEGHRWRGLDWRKDVA